jgi:small GTP-binding protein
MIRKKILLLGDFSVGKTSLIRRYVDDAFDDSYLTTIGVKISKKLCTINGVASEILIWDVEGATPQKKIPHSYLLGASGAIFVADSAREETIQNLDGHIAAFLSVNPNAKYVVAYNKSDLLTVYEKTHMSLGKNGFFTSAKDGSHVISLFTQLAKDMLT